MKHFFILTMSMVFLLGCSKKDGSGGEPTVAPSAAQENAQPDSGGTIVGNGGDVSLLKFTLFGLKSFDYWSQKTNSFRKTYAQCAKDLKSTEDIKNPWTEKEWLSLLLNKCGSEPLPKIGYFESIDNALRGTKLFLSDKLDCPTPNLCGQSWQAFPEGNKIYISPLKWNQLSEKEKIRESLLAYDALIPASQRSLMDQKLEEEIYQRVFQVDFSMDVFRNFIDGRGMKIVEDGSQHYTQEKIISQMSMAMDCIRLVDKRFPQQIDVKNISLIEKYYQDSYQGSAHRVMIEFKYESYRKRIDSYKSIATVRMSEKTLFLGSATSLQKCYNSVVSTGLKNPLFEAVDSGETTPETTLKLPIAGESELNLEFINIAFKSLDYVVQDQRKAEAKYKLCLKENQSVGSQVCQPPRLERAALDQILEVFPTVQVQETDQRLCTSDLPNCSEQDSLTAINRPAERQIVLNRAKWKSLETSAKIRLALHEVFGILGLETNDYHLSSVFAPLVYIEDFQVDFLADQLRSFLNARNILPFAIGDFYDHVQFQDRAVLLMDCINLVEQRFPGRLDIGMVSLRKKSHNNGNFEIGVDDVFNYDMLGLRYYDRSDIDPRFTALGRHALYLDQNTTLQQCYNKVVALGLK